MNNSGPGRDCKWLLTTPQVPDEACVMSPKDVDTDALFGTKDEDDDDENLFECTHCGMRTVINKPGIKDRARFHCSRCECNRTFVRCESEAARDNRRKG